MSVVERVSEAPERLRRRLNLAIRAAAGIAEDPPVVCDDPALAFTPLDSVVRLVNGDLPAMMIGGLAALFFEMLHPLTMAGVAQHSRYRTDALDRVRRTADFIGVTTYGSRDDAEAAIAHVRSIHERVRGVADDGREYRAGDPRLLSWIHCAGLSMFLASYQAFGPVALSGARADEYVAGAARVAAGLGADHAADDRRRARRGDRGVPARTAPVRRRRRGARLHRARRRARAPPEGRLPPGRRGRAVAPRALGARHARGPPARPGQPGAGAPGDPGAQRRGARGRAAGGRAYVARLSPPSTTSTWPVT